MKKLALLVGFLLVWQTWAAADVIIIDDESDFEIGGLYYQVTDFKEHYVTVSGYSTNETRIVIPDKVVYGNVEYIVTTIGDLSFRNNNDLVSVEIPNTIEIIEFGAFSNCRNLVSISIPNSVKSIEWCSFVGCGSLRYVEVPSSVTHIGKWAFSYCRKMEAIFIPKSVTTIEDRAFLNCPNLKIYCEAESQPEDWVDNYDSETVIWKSKTSKFQKKINNK